MDALPITGYSLINALGGTRKEVLHALAEGHTGLGPPPMDLPFATQVGAIKTELPELEGELSSWNTRLARFAAYLIQDLGPALHRVRSRWPKDRIGILLGTSTAGAEQTEHAYRHYIEAGQLPDSYNFWHQHTYGALLHVVRTLTGLSGPAWMTSTACSSSAKPIASARRLINWHRFPPSSLALILHWIDRGQT